MIDTHLIILNNKLFSNYFNHFLHLFFLFNIHTLYIQYIKVFFILIIWVLYLLFWISEIIKFWSERYIVGCVRILNGSKILRLIVDNAFSSKKQIFRIVFSLEYCTLQVKLTEFTNKRIVIKIVVFDNIV